MDLKPIKKVWDKVKTNKRITYPVIGVALTVTATASIVVPVVVASKKKSQMELTRALQEEKEHVNSIVERDFNFMPFESRRLHEAKNYKKPKDGTTKNGVVFQIKKWQYGDGFIDYSIELSKNNRTKKVFSGKLIGFATVAQVLERHKATAIQEFRNKYLITVKPSDVEHKAIKQKWSEYQDELNKHIESIQVAKTHEEVRSVLTDGIRERSLNEKISKVTDGLKKVKIISKTADSLPSSVDIPGYETYSPAKFVLKTRDPEKERRRLYLIIERPGTSSIEPVSIPMLNSISPTVKWWISDLEYVEKDGAPVLVMTISMEHEGIVVTKDINLNGLGARHKEHAEQQRRKIFEEKLKKQKQ